MKSTPAPNFKVVGSTGEYEDRHDWTVARFTTKRRADTWARRANAWAASKGLGGGSHVSFDARWDAPENPYDPCMYVDYTGVFYSVVKDNSPVNPPFPRTAR